MCGCVACVRWVLVIGGGLEVVDGEVCGVCSVCMVCLGDSLYEGGEGGCGRC